MKINRKTVEHIARLAALELSEEEVERFQNQLGRILEYIDKLQELDLSGVEPYQHRIPRKQLYREDQPEESCTVDACLQNAPEREDRYFKVPRVLGGET